MTPAMLGLAVVLVVSAIVAGFVMWQRRRLAPTQGGASGDPAATWLVDAGTVARDGRRVAHEVESASRDGEPGSSAAPEMELKLNALTRRLAALATSAPTAMDVRVCRSVAVSSRALGDALAAVGDVDTMPGPTTGRRELIDRHAEFELALTDLERHVDLL